MEQNLPALPQEPIRLHLRETVVIAAVALIIGLAIGALVIGNYMVSEEKRRTERKDIIMILTMRVLAVQKNINVDPRDINYHLLVNDISSSDIGQRPDTLSPFGIITNDMRKAGKTVAANRPRPKPRPVEMD